MLRSLKSCGYVQTRLSSNARRELVSQLQNELKDIQVGFVLKSQLCYFPGSRYLQKRENHRRTSGHGDPCKGSVEAVAEFLCQQLSWAEL